MRCSNFELGMDIVEYSYHQSRIYYTAWVKKGLTGIGDVVENKQNNTQKFSEAYLKQVFSPTSYKTRMKQIDHS